MSAPQKLELFYYPETSKRVVIEPVSLRPQADIKCHNDLHQVLLPQKDVVIHVPAQAQTLDRLQKYGFHITRNTAKAMKDDGKVDVEILYPHHSEEGFTLNYLIELIRHDFKDMLLNFIKREPHRFEFNIDVDEVLANNSFFELRIRKRGKVHHLWFKLY